MAEHNMIKLRPSIRDLFVMLIKDTYIYLHTYKVTNLNLAVKNDDSGYPFILNSGYLANIIDVDYIVLESLLIASASFFTTITAVVFIATTYHTNIDYEKSILKSIDHHSI
tara:strand:- start:76 stop:408 length:333 start_codon:yes stop_codon:yes gene_type:complete